MSHRASNLFTIILLALSCLLVFQGWQLRQTSDRLKEMERRVIAIANTIQTATELQEASAQQLRDARPSSPTPNPNDEQDAPGTSGAIMAYASTHDWPPGQAEQVIEIFAQIDKVIRDAQSGTSSGAVSTTSADEERSARLAQAQQQLIALLGREELAALRHSLGPPPDPNDHPPQTPPRAMTPSPDDPTPAPRSPPGVQHP